VRLSPPHALLFDMDGVLVRSEPVWQRVVEEAGLRFRGRAISEAEFAPTFGQGTRADIDVFGLACTVAELDCFYLERFRVHADRTWVDPEARGVLQALQQRVVRVAVVTNTMTPLAHDILAAAKLSDLVETVACADQVPNAKPAPDLVVHALARLGLEPGDAWMTGDSRYDREAAHAAGVTFIGYRQAGPKRVDRLGELLTLVDAA
jgi:phosphoglycolate phosphatase/AHBA synthesis associated protein